MIGDETYIYVRGINLIFGRARYYLYNAHGDVVQLTNTNGELTQNYNYDAFGNERGLDEDDTNPFRYCGEYYDTETGLYYLRARYYDPLIGRFTPEDTHWNTANMIYGDNPQKINEREDKLGLKTYSYMPELLSVIQSGNLYVYTINNPILYADPTGELAFPGQIHNMVVDHVANKFGLFREQTILYGDGRWGRADLIDYETGQVWDVKRDKTKQIEAGMNQVLKYVQNTWKWYPNKKLQVGNYIPSDFFVVDIGFERYIVTYRYAGNGVIAYDYNVVTDWAKVGEAAFGIVSIAGIVFIIVVSGGSAAPALLPLLAQ